jgi:protein involved in polysaccharide export with SLBB domain
LLLLCLLTALVAVGQAQERLLEPGDTVRIVCDEDARFDLERTIGTSGTVSIPKIGEVPAILIGLKRFEALLAELISSKLGEDVEIHAVEAPNGDTPLRVEGLLKNPYTRRWKPRLTIRELLADAIPQDGADARIVSLSTPDGASRTIDVEKSNIELRPGDRVIFGQAVASPIVLVVGPLKKPGTIPATDGLTLAKAIELSGGITGHGNPKRIVIMRRDGSLQPADLATDGAVKLRAGDTVSVSVVEHLYYVTVDGAVQHPGLVEYREGMTLTEALAQAGGPKGKKVTAAAIRRILDKQMRVTKYDLTKIYTRIDPDPVLEPSDLIVAGGR